MTSVFLPARAQKGGDAYLRFIPRTEMDIAVVGCAVNIILGEDGTVECAGVSLGAVPLRFCLSKKLPKRSSAPNAKMPRWMPAPRPLLPPAKPIDDKRGTVAFRKDVTAVLARRAARLAYTRALGEHS